MSDESKLNPELPERRVRFSEHYNHCPPWLQPFGVLLRGDGHLCTMEMRTADLRQLASRYGLILNGRGGVQGRAFTQPPARAQLRQLWLDLFDAQFAAHPFPGEETP
jgi:hypothetical protein